MIMASLLFKNPQLSGIRRAAGPDLRLNNGARHGLGPKLDGSCLGLMRALTAADLVSLSSFARFRLTRVGLNPADGEDIVQDALLAVLRGQRSSSTGRHPRPADIADKRVFIGYLHSVIGSLVEAERRRREHRFSHSPLEDLLAVDPERVLISTCDSSLDFADLKQEFFRCLYRQAPARLRDLIAAWDQQSDDCERIPLLGRHRRCRVELRKLAAQTFRKLSNSQIL